MVSSKCVTTVDSDIWSKEQLLYALFIEAKKTLNNESELELELNDEEVYGIEETLKDDDQYVEQYNGITIGVNFEQWPSVDYCRYDEHYGEGFFNEVLTMSDKYSVEYDKKVLELVSNNLHNELNSYIAERKLSSTDYTSIKNDNQGDNVFFLLSVGILTIAVVCGIVYVI